MKNGKNSRFNRVKQLVAAALITLSLGLPIPGSASLQDKMDSIFNDMTNTTKPGVYNAARRGVISGGSIINRSRIVNKNLFNFTPPHISAGCGGIDLFGGSFSFINADQFVELLRAIAANAKGYAFKVALDAASSLISVDLSELQRALQLLNSANINSCQLAQGLVNTAADTFGIPHKNKMDLTGALHGFVDVAQAFGHYGTDPDAGKKASETKETNEILKKDVNSLVGNYVWRALKNRGAKSMFYDADADENKEYEIIMSITGTVVMHKPEDNATSPQASDMKPSWHGPLVTTKDLLDGGNIKVYKCDDHEDCMKPAPDPNGQALVGLKTRITTAILGDGATTGIIAKLRNGSAFSENEKKVFGSLPNEAATIISNLSLYSNDVARAMANDLAYAIAGRLLFDDMLEYISTAESLVMNSTMQDKAEALKLLESSYNRLKKEQVTWNQQHKTLEDLLAYYERLNRAVDRITLNAR